MPGKPRDPFNPAAIDLTALLIGQSWSQVQRLDGDLASKESVRTALETIRGRANTAVSRAKALDDSLDFITEGFDARTRSFDILVGVSVTRSK